MAPGSGCPRQVRDGASSGTGPLCRTCFQIKSPGSQRNPAPFPRSTPVGGAPPPALPEARAYRSSIVAGGLQPGVAVQMADHPAGIHLEARRHCLGMQAPAGDGGEAVVHALEYLVPHKTGAEALRPVELEVIALRLGGPVGQIAGPVPPVVQHLAQHHIGPGGDILVKDGVYPALGHIAELAHAGVDPGASSGRYSLPENAVSFFVH